MLALFMIGDLLLCAPIWLLSYNIYNRNVFLYEFFPPNEKEIISTKISYILSFACPIFFIIAPLLQYGLFILYNRFGHPWCELLQSNPTGPHVFHTYELEMEDILKTENGAHEQLNMDSWDYKFWKGIRKCSVCEIMFIRQRNCNCPIQSTLLFHVYIPNLLPFLKPNL